MSMLEGVARAHGRLVDALRSLEGLGPLLLRLLLAPVLIQAGWTKFIAFDQTVAWFGNPVWGLGLPMPALWVVLAAGAELVGGVALVVGIATRYFAAALAVTMLVAMWTVHWQNGWLAISDASSWLANDRVLEAAERKARAIAILREHGDYAWLTERGCVACVAIRKRARR